VFVPNDAWDEFHKAFEDGLAERLKARAARLRAIRESQKGNGLTDRKKPKPGE
jgi:hypothetical protein